MLPRRCRRCSAARQRASRSGARRRASLLRLTQDLKRQPHKVTVKITFSFLQSAWRHDVTVWSPIKPFTFPRRHFHGIFGLNLLGLHFEDIPVCNRLKPAKCYDADSQPDAYQTFDLCPAFHPV